MSDIVYTIGAKDQATATLNKVDSAMERLEKTTKDLGDASEKSLGKFSLSIGSLLKATAVIGGVQLAVKGLQSAYSTITGTFASANAAYDTQVEAVKGLETALRLNGEAVETESARLQAYASQMQAFSGVGDEVTLGLMRQAAMLGVSSDQLDDTAAAAIGLSEATGKSLDESLKLVKNSLEGEFGAFGKIIPAIKQATTDSEKLAMIQELAAKGLDAKAESADRLAGAEERAAGAVGDLMEVIGGLIAPVREVIAIGIKAMAEALTGILAPAATYVSDLFERWKPTIMSAIEATVNGIIAGLTMAEVIFGNFGTVIGIVFDSILLKYETYRADTEHLFVTTIPAYISWFGDNFFNIIETAFSAVSSVVTEHIQKIGDTFQAFWDFIASGGSTDLLGELGDIAGRSYLTGFENSIEALPQIAERAMTATEKELQASIGATASTLAEEYRTKLEVRTVSLGKKIGENIADSIDLSLKKSSEEIDKAKKGKTGESNTQGSDALLQATQGRLITRGPGERQKDPTVVLERLAATADAALASAAASASELAEIKRLMQEQPGLKLIPAGP